jgi:exosortase H (IPTLxxWG-CTERM-specific)
MVSIAKSRRSLINIFSLRFVLLSGCMFVMINILPDTWFTDPLNRLTANITGLLLLSLGIPSVVQGVVISHDGFSIKIILECTAIHILLILISFMLAYPASKKQRVHGILIGSAVLFTTNVFRVAAIFIIGLHNRSLFQYVHVYIGQIIMVLLLILVTMNWLKSHVNVPVKDSPLGFLYRFFVFSCILFFIWLFLANHFVHANYLLVKTIFNIFNMAYFPPDSINLYPHTFNTFHIPGYAALILSTKSIDWKMKRRGLLIGIALLWAVFFLFLLHKILLFTMGIKPFEIPFVALVLINQWVLPFVLWVVIVHKDIFKPVGIYKCPICGAEKQGIMDHIRAKHGEEVLKSPRIQDFLENEGGGRF